MAYSNLPHSSSSIISGVPRSVTYYTRYVNHFMQALNLIAEQEAAALEDKLRDTGAQAWGDPGDAIRVKYNRKTVSIDIGVEGSPETLQAARTNEFGTPSQAPSPVIRNAAMAASQDVAENITRKLKEVMG